jgi:hypothetical protein
VFRFNALMTPMRAIKVGPLSSTTRSRAWTATCLPEILLGLGKLPDIVRCVLEVDVRTRQGNGLVERREHDI